MVVIIEQTSSNQGSILILLSQLAGFLGWNPGITARLQANALAESRCRGYTGRFLNTKMAGFLEKTELVIVDDNLDHRDRGTVWPGARFVL